MASRVWTWLVVGTGWSAFIVGCGGSTQGSAPGGAGSASIGTGGESTSPAGDTGGTDEGGAGRGSGGGGSAGQAGGSEAGGSEAGSGPTACTGELQKVAAEWWLECPATYCAALAWAQGCHSLPNQPTARAGSCQNLNVVMLDYGTHSKECYYSQGRPLNPPKLVGAAATDDTQAYCDGTSFRIEAGTTAACNSEVVCDGLSEAPTVDGDAPPPPACFNSFSSTCEPCCPATTPECTGKPNGYPGYRCTVEDNSYCSCNCSSETWSCGC